MKGTWVYEGKGTKDPYVTSERITDYEDRAEFARSDAEEAKGKKKKEHQKTAKHLEREADIIRDRTRNQKKPPLKLKTDGKGGKLTQSIGKKISKRKSDSDKAFKKYKDVIDNTSLQGQEMQIKVRESDLNARLRDFLKSQGFDGVQYRNTVEDRLAGDFSYIALDPQQYKIVTASQFDPNDPRVYKAEGGATANG